MLPFAVWSAEAAPPGVRWTLQAAGIELDPTQGLDDISESACDLLSGLLDVDEDRRLSVEDALQHPWFQEV